MSDKDSAVEFNQTTLTPFSDVGKGGDLVAAVRKIIGAEGEICLLYTSHAADE